MAWDERLFDLLDDLEGQAGALYAADREAELADRSRAEYAAVTLASRLVASVGRSVTLDLAGAGRVSGELTRVGAGWCLLRGGAREWLVPTDAVEASEGLSERAVPEVAWPSVAKLGLGSALRRLADEGAACVVVSRSGTRYDVVLERVGADFVEARVDGEEPRTVVLRLASVGVVHSGTVD